MIANDEEFAQAVLEANGGTLPEGDPNPPLSQWDQNSALLAQVITELRALKAVFIASKSPKGAARPKVQPVAVPQTAYSRLAGHSRMEKRIAVHDRLVSRLLGDRAKNQE